MTVQELIEELQKVEDKTLTVHYDCDGFNQPVELLRIEHSTFHQRLIVFLD